MDDLITYRARIGMFSVIGAFKSSRGKQRKYCGKSLLRVRQNKKRPCERMPNNIARTDSTFNIRHFCRYIFISLCLIMSGLNNCPTTYQSLLPDLIALTSASVCKVPCYISSLPKPAMTTYVTFNCSCDPLLGNAGIHSYNGNPRMHSSSSQTASDQYSHNLLSIPELHFEMVDQLNRSFQRTRSLWPKFKYALKWKTRLPLDLLEKAEDMFGVANLLEQHGDMSPGSYSKLKECLVGNDECLYIVNDFEVRMASHCDQEQVKQRTNSDKIEGNTAEENEGFPTPDDKSNSTLSRCLPTVPSMENSPFTSKVIPTTTSVSDEELVATSIPSEPTEERMTAAYPIERPVSSTVLEVGTLTTSNLKEGLVGNIDPNETTISAEDNVTNLVLAGHITPSISHEQTVTAVSENENMNNVNSTEGQLTTSFEEGPMANPVSAVVQNAPFELPVASSIPTGRQVKTDAHTALPLLNKSHKTTDVPTERQGATAVPKDKQTATNLSSEGEMAIAVPAERVTATPIPREEGNQLPLTVDLHQTFQLADIQQTQVTRIEPRIKIQDAQNVFTGNNNVVYYGADTGDKDISADRIQQTMESIEQSLTERNVHDSEMQDTLKSTQQTFTETIYDRANVIQNTMQNTEQRLVEKVSDFSISTENTIKSIGQQLTGTVNEQARFVQNALEGTEERLRRSINSNKTSVQHICAGVEELGREFQNAMIQQTKLLEKLGCATNIKTGKQANIIAQTESWISYQRKTTPFLQTKAFEDAKVKLCKSKVLIVKGNSGDGKTQLALALLAWLNGEEYWQTEKNPSDLKLGERIPSKKKPLHLKTLKLWDEVVSPNSQLAILVDDLLGYDFDTENEMGELKKCESYIIPVVEGDLCERANCIIMTVRNDIWLQYSESFSGKGIFCTENIIDLSTEEFSIEKEKEQLLLLYTPKSDFEHFSEKETQEIVTCSPKLGFPECCRIFLATTELHRGRVDFFRNPLIHIRKIIRNKFSKDKQVALLFLLFHGTVRSSQLEPGNDNVDTSIIDLVFSVSLSRKYDENTIDKCKRLQYIKGGFEALCDSFVKREKGIYRYFHNSVCDAVAILFGEQFPQLFLMRCNIKLLRYIATSESTDKLCKVVIEEDNFQCAFKRICCELSCNDEAKSSVIASLIPWDDHTFTDKFLKWIDENKYLPKDFHLNQGKSSDGNVVDNGNRLSFLNYVSMSNKSVLLKRLIDRCAGSDIQMKLALDVALASGSETCAKIILDIGVKPDDKSCFDAVIGGKLCLLKYLGKQVNFLTAKSRISNNCDINLLVRALGLQKLDIVVWLAEQYPLLLHCSIAKMNILHFTALIGNIQLYQVVAEALLRSKNKQEFMAMLLLKDNLNILHAACFEGRTEMCVYLCNTYPFLLTQRDKNNLHCLHFAAISRSLSCYQAIESYVFKEISVTERDNFMKSLTNVKKQTVLHLACASGSEKVCTYLCNTYPSLIKQRDTLNCHCLHSAAWSGNMSCYKAMESMMLTTMSCKAREEYMATLTAEYGYNVLHISCLKGNTGLCTHLFKRYPSLLTKTTSDGFSYLHMAAFYGSSSSYQVIESVVLDKISAENQEQHMETMTNNDAKTVLHLACGKGETELCMYLSNTYPSLIRQTDANNIHCIHYAAASGNLICYKAMESLVLKDIPEERQEQYMSKLTDNNEKTVLHWACPSGSKELCMYLCNAYPSLIEQIDTNTHNCLHYAVISSTTSCFQAMESYVLDKISTEKRTQHMETMTDKDAVTVLHLACRYGKTELCMYLSNTYPSLIRQTDADNIHCIHYAAASGNLICYKAMESLVLKDTPEERQEQYMSKLTDNTEKTVLHWACTSGSTELCMYLCNAYPSLIDPIDTDTFNCLHCAVISNTTSCFQAMESYMLDKISTEKRTQYMEKLTDKDAVTVLHLACRFGKTEMCMYLSNTYPSLITQNDATNEHCLHYAAESGSLICYKAMESLVLKSIEQEQREQYMTTLTDNYERTVVHFACMRAGVECCMYLTNRYPSLIIQRDADYKHCLHYAAESGNVSCYKSIEFLVLKPIAKERHEQYIASLIDFDGRTVLHFACSSGSKELCMYLCRTYPSLMDQRDAGNKPCLHYAVLSGDVSFFQTMKSLVLDGSGRTRTTHGIIDRY